MSEVNPSDPCSSEEPPKNPEATRKALLSVAWERERQDQIWSRQPGKWMDFAGTKLLVLAEEVGEVAEALLERQHISHLRTELVQVAAVCVAWIETIDCDNEKLLVSRDDVLRRVLEELNDTMKICNNNDEKNLLRAVYGRIASAL